MMSSGTKIAITSSVYRSESIHGLNGETQECVNQYRLLETIGCGSFGLVQRCEVTSSDGGPLPLYAMKIIDRKRAARKRWLKSRCADEESFPDDVEASHCDDATSSGARAQGVRMVYQTALDMIYKEIYVLEKLKGHKSIVKLYEVLDDPTDFAICLVLEYLSGGPVMEFDKESKTFKWGKCMLQEKDTQQVMLRYARSLFEGLSHMHSLGICHRDIKPENLLIGSDGELRIIDFGCATSFRVGASACRCVNNMFHASASASDACNICRGLVVDTVGTPAFWGPECMPIEEEGGAAEDDLDDMLPDMPPLFPSSHSPPISSVPPMSYRHHYFSAYTMDCWAAGVTLYCFLFKRLPIAFYEQGSDAAEEDVSYISQNAKVLAEISNIKEQNISWTAEGAREDESTCTNAERGLVLETAKRLMVVDVTKRWTAAQALDCLLRSESLHPEPRDCDK